MFIKSFSYKHFFFFVGNFEKHLVRDCGVELSCVNVLGFGTALGSIKHAFVGVVGHQGVNLGSVRGPWAFPV